MHYVIAALIGMLSGITSGMFGVGGGIVMVPAMMFFMNLPIKQAIGTSLVVIIPTAIIGTYKHHLQSNVSWTIAFSLVPTAVIGGFVGAWLTTQIPAESLRRVFGAFLMIVGLRLVLLR